MCSEEPGVGQPLWLYLRCDARVWCQLCLVYRKVCDGRRCLT